MLKNILIGLYCIVLCSVSYSQIRIQGQIKDATTKEPIPGVNIHAPYTLVGTSANESGRFVLKIDSSVEELLVSSIGYKSQVLKAPFQNEINILLTPSVVELAGVNIEGKVDKKWKSQFKKFEKAFIGTSKIARKCKILNPWVVDFSKNNENEFVTNAKAPIQIENKATGYFILFQLDQFAKKGDVVTISGKPYYTDQLSSDNTIKSMQLRARESTYQGSKIHFLKSVLDNTLTEEGFEVYQGSQDNTTGDFIRKRRVDKKYLMENDVFRFDDLLQIIYTKEEDLFSSSQGVTLPANGGMTGSVVGTTNHQVSYLAIKESIYLSQNGIPSPQENLIEYGYWNKERVAEMLPMEYLPDRLKD